MSAVFTASAGKDRNNAILQLQVCSGADPVAFGLDFKRTARNIDESERRILRIFCMNPIFTGVDCNRRIYEPYAVVCIKPVRSGINKVCAARDNKIVLRYDAMPRRRMNRKRAGSVQRQILL